MKKKVKMTASGRIEIIELKLNKQIRKYYDNF